jgi:methylphosphotriester-DNA--protein-cysteine methyltransferase
LVPYIECYWFSHDPQGTPGHAVLPDGCVDILFSPELGQLSAVGLMTVPQRLDIPPGTSYFGVRFRPAMAAAFLAEAPELTDRVEPLASLWGERARRLEHRLQEAPRNETRIQIVESELVPASLPLLAGSPRRQRRLCVAASGVPPKYLSRILRFRAASEAIRRLADQPNWAHFAAVHGYYDQAHFIHEFQEFAQTTPGRFLQSHLARA